MLYRKKGEKEVIDKVAVWVLPLTVILAFAVGTVKKVKVFDSFVRGAKNGLKTVYDIFPNIVALVVAVTMLRESGGMELITGLLSPVARILGVPEQIIPIGMLTPFSGGGALSLFRDVLEKEGADSFVGQVASVLMGATDTTFYAVSIYYGSIGIKKTRHTLLAGLAADFVSLVLSSFFIKVLL